MSNFRTISHLKYKRTKVWIVTFYVFTFVFVYYLLIWLLLGEINLLKLNLTSFFGQFVDPKDHSRVSGTQLDSRMFYFTLIPLVFHACFILLIRVIFKQLGYDMIPLVYSFCLGMITIIFTGLFNNAWSLLVLFGRIVLVVITFFITLMVLNYLVNRFILLNKNASNYFESILNQELTKKHLNERSWKLKMSNQNEILDVATSNIFLKKKNQQNK